MESRRTKDRQPAYRRSCDQCRARKVGCDRVSPCSNCTFARVQCTHSAVARNDAAPKQRVLISEQYEQKIDGIARDLDGIKSLLANLPRTNEAPLNQQQPPREIPTISRDHVQPVSRAVERETKQIWDHSSHIIDFVKSVVADAGNDVQSAERANVLSSLKRLTTKLERSTPVRLSVLSGTSFTADPSKAPMPPLEAVVDVLRWAKAHSSNTRIQWISEVLPLQRWMELCQKVFFAIDDYSSTDVLLANGYLSYIFFENIVVTGREDYREYCCMCRANLHTALARLPLLLPASVDTIAALVLGIHNAIEESRASVAWTFCSAAASLCQTLGYHQRSNSLSPSEESLFWVVYRMDKALAMRLSRASLLRQSDVTRPIDQTAPRQRRFAAIQERVYDDLCGPSAISRPRAEAVGVASTLANQLQALINETSSEMQNTVNDENDRLRVAYVQMDLVLQMALLCQVLRVVPGKNESVSDECVTAARKTLEVHQQCVMTVQACVTNCYVMTRYINWTITHSPFAPFSILFSQTIRYSDVAELECLESFAASLQPEKSSMEVDTHPYQLYQLLCRAARLHIGSGVIAPQTMPAPDTTSLLDATNVHIPSLDFSNSMSWGNAGGDDNGSFQLELSNWFDENQIMMGLLEDHAFITPSPLQM